MSPHKPLSDYLLQCDTLHLNLTPRPDSSDSASLLSIRKGSHDVAFRRGAFYFEQVPSQDYAFWLRYRVTHDVTGLLGTVHTDRKVRYDNQQHLLLFRLDNAALYSAAWIPTLTAFFADTGLTIATYAQVHIAIDTQQNALKAFHKLQDDPAVVLVNGGKLLSKVATVGSRAAGGKYSTSVVLGSVNSARRSMVYNKTEELATSGKTYIQAHHAANGFDPAKDVYRVELRLTHDAFKAYSSVNVNLSTGETISPYKLMAQDAETAAGYAQQTVVQHTLLDYRQLATPGYLLGLFSLHNNIDFRAITGSRNISRYTPIRFVNTDIYPKQNLMTTTTIQPPQDTNRAAKQSIKTLIATAKQTRKPQYLDAAITLATDRQCLHFYYETLRAYGFDFATFAGFEARPDGSTLTGADVSSL